MTGCCGCGGVCNPWSPMELVSMGHPVLGGVNFCVGTFWDLGAYW
jgi:hypothetical protein